MGLGPDVTRSWRASHILAGTSLAEKGAGDTKRIPQIGSVPFSFVRFFGLSGGFRWTILSHKLRRSEERHGLEWGTKVSKGQSQAYIVAAACFILYVVLGLRPRIAGF